LLRSGEAVPQGAAYIWHRTPAEAARAVQLPDDPARYASAIYGALHELDAGGFTAIAIERVPKDIAAWAGIADRLERASASD
jgi:L-threonylcarbamoyladenylate synthase